MRTLNLLPFALLPLLMNACGSEEDNPGDLAAGGQGGASSGGSSSGTGSSGNTTDEVPGTNAYDCSAPSGEIPALKLTSIVEGFQRPVLVTHAPDDKDRLFVVEQGGLIRIIEDLGGTPTIRETPFLDLSARVRIPTSPGSEFGLLGLAFHPDYAENGLIYVYYSAAVTDETAEQDGVLAEYSLLAGDENRIDPDSGRTLFALTDRAENHNGGTLAFGPDRMLYVSLGDEGGGGDTFGNAQNPATLWGSLLRLDVDGRDAGEYGIPAGNLVESIESAAPEVWDYGLRNPYRMNFDGCTGDLFIGDVGQDDWEEIDIEPKGLGHRNYGWNIVEGTHCYGDPSESCDQSGLVLPVAEFDNTGGSAVVGGAVYRGSAIPGLRGTYFYADAGTGRVWTLEWDGEAASTPVSRTDDLETAGLPIHSIQNGGDGEIYISAADGHIYRLDAE